jgi:hypothetical protein
MTAIPEGNTTYALGIGRQAGVGIGHTGAHPGYVNLVCYNPVNDLAIVVVQPYIDYRNLKAQLDFMVDLGKSARAIAGFTDDWPPKK